MQTILETTTALLTGNRDGEKEISSHGGSTKGRYGTKQRQQQATTRLGMERNKLTKTGDYNRTDAKRKGFLHPVKFRRVDSKREHMCFLIENECKG